MVIKNLTFIHAYDHWSADTRQDAWFTASSLDAVFASLNPKPKWVIIMSDNGPHYHNTEMMLVISCWKEWYDIECKRWVFLEAGEAKTSIDSHHAQVRCYFPFFVNCTHLYLITSMYTDFSCYQTLCSSWL